MIKFKKIGTNILLFSFILVFAIGILFTAEILFRTFGPVASKGTLHDLALFPYKHYVVTTHPDNLVLGKSDHLLEYAFAKGVCTAPDGVTTARFNSDGFRTHEFKNLPPKEPGEIRIILTGASVAIGWNTGEACTLDSNLYRLFAKQFPNKKVRIFNLGNGAWKSFQELIALQLYGLKLEPDLVITFDGVNDISHSFAMPIEQPYSNNVVKAFQRYENWAKGGVSELFKSLKTVDLIKDPARKVLTYFKKNKNPINSTNGEPEYPLYAVAAKPGSLETRWIYPYDFEAIEKRTDFDPHNQEAVNFYLMNERLMAKAASSVNAKIIFALSPNIYFKTPLTDQEQIALKNYKKSANYVIQGYLRIRKGLTKIEKEEDNAIFYDLSTMFEGDPQTIFGDEAHIGQNGYSAVATKLFPKIVEVLNLN